MHCRGRSSRAMFAYKLEIVKCLRQARTLKILYICANFSFPCGDVRCAYFVCVCDLTACTIWLFIYLYRAGAKWIKQIAT